jgi:hypothetical protein
MARIKLKANESFNVLEALGLSAGTIIQLVAITDTEWLRVFSTATAPDVLLDDCVPLVFGTQTIETEPTDAGVWLHSEDNAQVYVNRPFDPDWLLANPQ